MDEPLDIALTALVAAAAAVWLIALAALDIAGRSTVRDGTATDLVSLATRIARVSRRVILPAALVVAAAGAVELTRHDLSTQSHTWVGSAVALWLVAVLGTALDRTMAAGRAVQVATLALGDTGGAPGPTRRSLALDEDADLDEDARWRTWQLRLLARCELLVVAVGIAAVVVGTS